MKPSEQTAMGSSSISISMLDVPYNWSHPKALMTVQQALHLLILKAGGTMQHAIAPATA